ncbi:MAG: sensor histidine kinase [Acidimicrobiales bacterium]
MRILRAPFSRRTPREVAYVLLTLLPAVPAFALALVGLVAGALSLVGVGLPVLAAVLAVGRLTVTYWRPLARATVGWDWPSPPRLGGRGALRRVGAVLRDGVAWRALVYCLVKLPLSAVAAYGTIVGVAVGVPAATYPVWWLVSPTALGLLDHRPWIQTWLLAGQGALVLLVLPWFVRLLVAVDRALVNRLLAPDPARARIATLEASRDALAADAAATLRRVERDLHDGTQARLVMLGLLLVRLEGKVADPESRDLVEAARRQVVDGLDELREIIRGMHPPALDDGLPTALATLASRSALPVYFRSELRTRLTDAQAATLYFSAAELLANLARHAGATSAAMELRDAGDSIVLVVRDDGHGGAAPLAHGTGLAGLDRRARALDGTLVVDSPPGGPTTVTVTLPKDERCA